MVDRQQLRTIAKMDTAAAGVDVEVDAKAGDNAERVSLTQLPSTRRPLLPILPHYPPPAGALVVDKEETQLGACNELLVHYRH